MEKDKKLYAEVDYPKHDIVITNYALFQTPKYELAEIF